MIRWILGVLLFAGLASCSKTSAVGNHPPQITLISVTPEEFSISKRDTITIAFKIDDKNGDVGSVDNQSEANLFVRYGDVEFGAAKLPVISPEYQNPETGFHGTAVAKVTVASVILDSLTSQVGDTQSFQLYILDNAKNHSDTITTSPIILRP